MSKTDETIVQPWGSLVEEKPNIDVLIIEDDRGMAHLLKHILESEGYGVSSALSMDEAKRIIKEKHFPIIVSDIGLGHENGLSLLPLVGEHGPKKGSVFIFITGQASVETAVTAIQGGAFEYLSKPGDLKELESSLKGAVDRAARHLGLREEGRSVRPIAPSGEAQTIVGKSPQMANVYRAIARAASFRGNVLIRGESGTGKELVARAIHQNGPAAAQPFVTVNCAALTDTLLESELFGHVKGSFTGAVGNKRGLFEEANGGTLFLDEIGDVSPAVQVKMLRAIQEGDIKPVGSTETHHVDVRVVAATHRDLEAYVKEGRFREDLYFRLKVFEIEIPPLRSRVEDLLDLVDFFAARASQENGKKITGISRSAVEMLELYPWPGNIRELEHAIQRAMAVCNTYVLFPEDFPDEIVRFYRGSRGETVGAEEAPADKVLEPKNATLREMERNHIIRTLKEVAFNKSKAAQLLGIDRVTLYRKAAQYGIPLSYPEKPAAVV